MDLAIISKTENGYLVTHRVTGKQYVFTSKTDLITWITANLP